LDKQRFERGVFNNFFDSLVLLKNLNELKILSVKDTNIWRGIENLPSKLEVLEMSNEIINYSSVCLMRHVFNSFVSKDGSIQGISRYYRDNKSLLMQEYLKSFEKHFQSMEKSIFEKKKEISELNSLKEDLEKNIDRNDLRKKIERRGFNVKRISGRENKIIQEKNNRIKNLEDQLKIKGSLERKSDQSCVFFERFYNLKKTIEERNMKTFRERIGVNKEECLEKYMIFIF
jgi:hypothetical protein